jgi:hypothetical protein
MLLLSAFSFRKKKQAYEIVLYSAYVCASTFAPFSVLLTPEQLTILREWYESHGI